MKVILCTTSWMSWKKHLIEGPYICSGKIVNLEILLTEICVSNFWVIRIMKFAFDLQSEK